MTADGRRGHRIEAVVTRARTQVIAIATPHFRNISSLRLTLFSFYIYKYQLSQMDSRDGRPQAHNAVQSVINWPSTVASIVNLVRPTTVHRSALSN